MQLQCSDFHQISEESMAHTCSMLDHLSHFSNMLLGSHSCLGKAVPVLYSTQCIFPSTLPELCNSLGGGKSIPVATPQTAGIQRKKPGAFHDGSPACDAVLVMDHQFEDAEEHRARGRITPMRLGCKWEVRWGSLWVLPLFLLAYRYTEKCGCSTSCFPSCPFLPKTAEWITFMVMGYLPGHTSGVSS